MQTTVLQESGKLSDEVIPSVPGEFYGYSAEFTFTRPLYPLFKCKANKARPLEDVEDLANEVDLVFLFGSEPRVCSPNSDPAIILLNGLINAETLNQTWLAHVDMTEAVFYQIRSQKDGQELAKISSAATTQSGVVVALKVGAIIAIKTNSGKYGLILVRELTPTSIIIDACHILI